MAVLHLLVFIFAATAGFGQNVTLNGRRITQIQLIPADILHQDDMGEALPMKAGSVFRQEEVGEAIDRLFATGRFEDIVAEAEPSGEGVILRFVTTPARFVGGVSVEGKTSVPPGRGEIASTARLQLGQLFQEEDVERAAQRIRRLLRSNGLYEAEVTPEVQPAGRAQDVFVTFRVKSGKRAKYAMPAFHGETKLSDGTILRATGWRVPIIHYWRHVTDSRTRKGIQGILGKYQGQERLTARVELEKLDYDPTRRRVHPQLNITPGPKVKVNAVEAKVSKRVMKRYVPIFQERTVDNDLLVEGARNLRDYFQSKGYYDVDVDFRTKEVANDEQIIEYVIAQGQRYKMTSLDITGNKYFSEDDLLERMFMAPATFTMRRGRYSEAFRKKDEENIANLYRANGFRDVNVTSIVDRDFQGKTGEVGVTLQIEEGPQWTVDTVTLNGVQEGDHNLLASNLASLEGQPFSEVNMAADRSLILTWYYSRGFPQADFKAGWQQTGPNRVSISYTVVEGERQYVRDVILSGLKTTRQSLVDERITLQAGRSAFSD